MSERRSDLEPDRPEPLPLAFLLRHGVPASTLAEAARIARACGVVPDVALIRTGLLDQDTLYRAAAAEAGLPFLARDLPVHPRAKFPDSVLKGVVPLSKIDSGAAFAWAPEGEVLARVAEGRLFVPGVAITTPSTVLREVLRAKAGPIATLASDGLPRRDPDLSFRDGPTNRQAVAILGLGGTLTAWSLLDPDSAWLTMSLSLGTAFLLTALLRVAAVADAAPIRPALAPPRADDGTLPIYTVIVPLRSEGRVLPRLLAALAALDYPAPKLDVKIVIEADDPDTAAALARVSLPPFAEVLVAPLGVPKTKPRALNVALAVARGEFTVIYDAEDVPDPDQLRLAVSFFERLPSEVVCLQARLAIDNTADTALTRFFTAEYAGLFDVVNPALIRFGLPITLGGTSNHFRGIRQQTHQEPKMKARLGAGPSGLSGGRLVVFVDKLEAPLQKLKPQLALSFRPGLARLR